MAERERAARLVRITVRVGDIDEAIGSIHTSHGDRCVSGDNCDCVAVARRLERAIGISTGELKR